MPAFCLDSLAILALRDDEPGAERVATLLEGPETCFACFITRMEVLYRVWKDEGERSGRLAYEQLLMPGSPPRRSSAEQHCCIRIRNLRL